jgi:hypothetical protein
MATIMPEYNRTRETLSRQLVKIREGFTYKSRLESPSDTYRRIV